MMRARRLRATLFLKTVVLVGSAAAFVGVCMAVFAGPLPLSVVVWTAGLLALAWMVGIEADLLPMIIERVIIRWAGKQPGTRRSLWLVDADAEAKARSEARREAMRDNPSLW